MKRLLAVALLLAGALATAGCAAQEHLPQYMQDAPRSDEEVRKATAEIKKELGDDYTVDCVEGIFYLATNCGVDSYKQARDTVQRMYRFLTKNFFDKKPERPLRVYCFKNAATYEKYCEEAYSKPPSTPYGFYMPSERKMVMNLATGTGTLAHELVHPMLAEDFPTVPSWFNEGFASLYEQSMGDSNGYMEGKPNWRLKGLKQAMKEDRAISLSDLLKTTTQQFYDETRGVNYATARYLCKWLQDQKLLQDFYREFRKNAKDDPTGLATLEKVSGMKVDALDKIWREWVPTQKWP